ncbi:hypothetical protein [Gayadomonas joobiniege]|uniref:hypothetical protein n=1 Tax=Gayadomonas joobiniege TaxID=1234606 RepID=UPI000371CE09|nr:hypothetical protein [Gayadomonas joobiniege]
MDTLSRSSRIKAVTPSYKVCSSLIFFALALAGCGSDKNTKTGQFVDSPVEGIHYISGDISGVTDSEGKFEYNSGHTVSFYVGDILLGQANGDSIVTPVDLVAEADNSSHPTVINIARFLQTLDDDGNPNNGIRVLPQVSEQATEIGIDFNVSTEDFANNTNIQQLITKLTKLTNAGQRVLVSALAAQQHLQTSLLNYLEPTNEDDPDNQGPSDGTYANIKLSGSDAVILGQELVINDIAYFAPNELGSMQPALMMIVSKGLSIKGQVPAPNSDLDPNDYFVINAFEYGISMSVNKNGQSYDYVCTTIASDAIPQCGSGFAFDVENKTLTLNNVNVYNEDNNTNLSLTVTLSIN